MRNNTSTFTTTIEWNQDTGEEREIEVNYAYHRGCRGARDSLGGVRGAGPPLEPDEPPSVEIQSVMMHSPTFHDREAREDVLDSLSKSQLEWLEEKCFEDVQERRDECERERHGI